MNYYAHSMDPFTQEFMHALSFWADFEMWEEVEPYEDGSEYFDRGYCMAQQIEAVWRGLA